MNAPMKRTCRFVAIVLLLAPAPAARAQERAPASPGAGRPVVAVIGASVSAGFQDFVTSAARDAGRRNRTMSLWVALRKVWPAGVVTIGNHGQLLFFQDPARHGGKAVNEALATQPSLVVALDFLFWFGAGAAPRGEGEAAARLAKQKLGLELLERFPVPMIVGDYPDMTGADPEMIPPSWVPGGAALEKLNGALREWAAARKNVRLFPLSQFVKAAKLEGETIRYHDREVKLPPLHVLQTDRLHATKLGMVFLTWRLVPHLRAALPDAAPPERTIEELIDLFGVAADLPAESPAPVGREEEY
jgi:hypothetical protein